MFFSHTGCKYTLLQFTNSPAPKEKDIMIQQIDPKDPAKGFEIQVKLPENCAKLDEVFFMVNGVKTELNQHPKAAESINVVFAKPPENARPSDGGKKPAEDENPKAPEK